MNLSSSRILWWVLAPAFVLVLAAWYQAGALGRREAALAREIAGLREELTRSGFEPGVEKIEARRAQVAAEIAYLERFSQAGFRLWEDDLVRSHAALPFQLIEFERERASVAQALRDQAKEAGVKLEPSAFEVLADHSESPSQPRRRWAQLAIARAAAARAIEAKVAAYEALPVPAVRELRVEKSTPVIAEEILFSVRVTGESARVQAFIEYLALGAKEGDARFFIEHLVLRKDGVVTPDLASATVVFAGLLPPSEVSP